MLESFFFFRKFVFKIQVSLKFENLKRVAANLREDLSTS